MYCIIIMLSYAYTVMLLTFMTTVVIVFQQNTHEHPDIDQNKIVNESPNYII